MTRVLVAGGTGFIGSALTRRLLHRGDQVVILSRSDRPRTDGAAVRQWDPARAHLSPAVLGDVDVVVNLVGAGIGDRRWTSARRLELVLSRTAPTRLLSEAIAAGRRDGSSVVRALVQGSAVGYYGDRPDRTLTEASPAGDGFIPDLVQQWEAAAMPAEEAGIRVAVARTGLVLAAHGGALARMLPLIRFGLGGPLGTGHQNWAWITLEDQVSALVHLIDSDVSGPVNLAGPNAATNSEVTAAIAHAFNRPSWFAVPRPALRLALGGFAAEILASQDVSPDVLTSSGFRFAHPDVVAAATWLRASFDAANKNR